MASKVINTKLSRIIGQIKYRPTLASFKDAPLIAQELESEFAEWQASKSDDITLFSPEEKKFIQITSELVTYLNEKDQDMNELNKYVKKIFAKSVKDSFIQQIRRIGVRSVQIISTPFKFEEIVDLINKKFYQQSKEFENISGDKPRDVVFILDGEKNGFFNHVQIGPVKKKEALKFFSPTFPIDKDIIENDQNIFIDVDVFANDDLNAKNTIEKLEAASSENLRIFSEYLKYLTS